MRIKPVSEAVSNLCSVLACGYSPAVFAPAKVYIYQNKTQIQCSFRGKYGQSRIIFAKNHSHCSVLQCVAVCHIMLQCVTVCCSVLQCVAVCYSVLQCVTVCCSVLQCVAACYIVLQCVTVCCSVSQCNAVCCVTLK